MSRPVILASGSKIRRDLLVNAGLAPEVIPARIDEDSIKQSLLAEQAKPHEIADTLAEYKALRVAANRPDALVIGCDQVLVCEGRLFDKARSNDAAIETLKALRGKPHQLLSAAVIFEDGRPVWRTIGRAQLFMRDFSDTFVQDYVAANSPGILASVGCYKLEEQGVQLFTRVQGDYFTVLGFPLLEVLEFLRNRSVLNT